MKFAFASVIVLSGIMGALAETHRIHFNNRCGSGTPTLIHGQDVLSRGQDYVSNGPFTNARAYLNNGHCLFNGEGCTVVELTLVNPDPARPGSGSSVDVSLIPPLAFSSPVDFRYNHGCDGAGASCGDANCHMAFRKTDDYFAQVQCQANDVNLDITFC